jgi:peptidoglycan/LPS O-acetylase OafA/YrhL
MLTHDTPTQPGVEAWRGLAAWLVVYAHFWSFGGSDWLPMRFAHTGVDLFFVLSGFVFAPYLWGKPLSAPAFALRRFFRIYPAYLLALGVYVAMKLQAGHAPQYLWQHLSFMQVQSREMAFYYNPPFWSLPAEVEFYVLLPLLAWGLRRLPHWGLAAVLLLSAAWRVWLGAQGDIAQQDAAYILQFHLPGIGVEFLLGALAWRLGQRGLSAALRWALVLAGLALWWTLAVWFGQVGDAGVNAGPLKGQMGWLAALCFALMVAGSLARPRLQGASPALPQGLQHSLWQRLALRMGQLSYGVYLFHIAALQLAAHWQSQLTGFPLGHQGLAVLLTLLMAWACHALWEEPWRRWGRRQADRLQGKLLQNPSP